MRALLAIVGLMLVGVVPCAAVSMTDTVLLGESLSFVIIHGGRVCSSGWQPDVTGRCVSDEDVAPLSLLADVALGSITASEVIPSLLVAVADPPLAHTPEPATLCLVGMTLVGVGFMYRRRTCLRP
jgi:hypothetical protein